MFFQSFSITDILRASVILFAVINVLGSLPAIFAIRENGVKVQSKKEALYAFGILIFFLFAGEYFLSLFNVDISSFAVAGSIVVFIIGLEMVMNIKISNKTPVSDESATFSPIVFPLLIGAGTLTTLIAIKTQYATVNILMAIVINSLIIYFILKSLDKIEKILGHGLLFIFQKFFGMILIAISVKLFVTNVSSIVKQIYQ